MLDFSSESYESLYVEHEPSARRLALSMVPADVADDIVAEAFARVLAALRAGGGPDHAFRAYLLTAVRHLAYDWQQTRRRLTVVADMDVQAEDDAAGPDPVSPQIACAAEVQAEARDEARLVTRAFGRLPARWRAVLWQLEVEGETPAAVAPIFGLSANGVSALAMRAREGLRQAYLEEHVGTNIPAECRSYAAEFGAGARGRLGQRRRAAMQEHLGHCPSCQYLFTELTELNSRLGAILTPAALAAASSALGSAKRTVHLRTALTSHWRTWRWHPVTTVSGAAAGIAVAGGMLLAVNITPLTSTPAHAAVAPVAPASGSPVSTRNPGGDAAAGSAARTSAHAALLSSVGTGSLVGAGSPASTIAPSETSPSASITPARSSGPAPAGSAAGSGLVTVTNTPPSPGQPITDTTTSAVTGLTDTATYAVTGLTDTATNPVAGLTETATNAVTGLAKTAGVAVTGLANTAGATVTVVTDTASGLASAATSTVNGATSTAIGAVTGITSNAGTTLATAGKTVSNVARTATNAATTVVGTATSTATSVAAPAATTVTSAAAAVPSLASTAAAATASTVGTASTAVTAVASTATAAVASTASTATTATATTVSTAVAATTTAVARTTTSTAGSVAEPVASTAVTATAGSNSTNIATAATNTVSAAVGSL